MIPTNSSKSSSHCLCTTRNKWLVHRGDLAVRIFSVWVITSGQLFNELHHRDSVIFSTTHGVFSSKLSVLIQLPSRHAKLSRKVSQSNGGNANRIALQRLLDSEPHPVTIGTTRLALPATDTRVPCCCIALCGHYSTAERSEFIDSGSTCSCSPGH